MVISFKAEIWVGWSAKWGLDNTFPVLFVLTPSTYLLLLNWELD